jgi:hypothetical protein
MNDMGGWFGAPQMNRTACTCFFLECCTLLIGLLFPSCATEALHEHPVHPCLEEGHDWYLQGAYDRSIDVFTGIIRSRDSGLDPMALAGAYRFRGECYKATRAFSRARFDFERAIQTMEASEPGFPKNHSLTLACRINTGDTYLLEGAFGKGDEIFEELLRLPLQAAMKDRLLYRRYICALKRNKADPEQFTRRIQDLRNVNEKELRKAFLTTGIRSSHSPPERVVDHRTPPIQTGKLTVLNRSEWRARPTRSNVDPMTPITRITVHHMGDFWEDRGRRGSAERLLSYQKMHQDQRGWADLGYHFVIDREGRIWEGRPLKYQGAHAGNAAKNRGNIGISLMGDYDVQRLRENQKESLVKLLTTLCDQYRLSMATQVLTHLELRVTECPGKNLQAFMDEVRRIYP